MERKKEQKSKRRCESSPRPEQPTIVPASYTTSWDLTAARATRRLPAMETAAARATYAIPAAAVSIAGSLLVALAAVKSQDVV